MDKRVKQVYACAKMAVKDIEKLPCRVDEMTEREFAIYMIASNLCGSMMWIRETLYTVLKESK